MSKADVRQMTPWTLRALLMIFESPDPVLREVVLYEAGKMIPPAVAVHIRDRDRQRLALADGSIERKGKYRDPEYKVEMGRRRILLENLSELIRKGRIVQYTDDGRVFYRPGDRPYNIVDLLAKKEESRI